MQFSLRLPARLNEWERELKFLARTKFGAGLAVILTGALLTPSAIAGEKEDALIARIVDAYGGEHLTGLKGLTLKDTLTEAFPGQGYTPDFVEIDDVKRITQFDFEGGRGGSEIWIQSHNGIFHDRFIFDGKNGYSINYAAGSYSSLPNLFAVTGRYPETVDALLARELSQQAETAEYIGSAVYLGRPHETIMFTQTGGQILTLFVDSKTGLISKMTREANTDMFYYHYREHANVAGITFAKRLHFFVNKDLSSTFSTREVTVNPRFSYDAFVFDHGLTEEPERIDVSELAYRKISDRLAHVGQGGGFSAFVDAGDYLIGVGGYPGLKDRLAKFREETGNDKPYRYQIVTHHHRDHLAGMGEANDLGVTFVVHPTALSDLRDAVNEDISDERLMIVEDRATLGGGAVKVYDIATSHADHSLLTVATDVKAAFMADHFGSPYVNFVPPAGLSGVRLHQAIIDLGIDVDVLLSAHLPGARSWAAFEAAVAAYDPNPCKFNRPICQ